MGDCKPINIYALMQVVTISCSGNLLGQVYQKVCTILNALPLFMLTDEQGVGFIKEPDTIKQQLAKSSKFFECGNCGFKYEDFKDEFEDEQIQQEKDTQNDISDQQQQKQNKSHNDQIKEDLKEQSQKQIKDEFDALKFENLLNIQNDFMNILSVIDSYETEHKQQNLKEKTVSKNIYEKILEKFEIVENIIKLMFVFYISYLVIYSYDNQFKLVQSNLLSTVIRQKIIRNLIMRNFNKFLSCFFLKSSQKLIKNSTFKFCNQLSKNKPSQQQEIKVNIFQEIQNLNCRSCGVSLQISDVYEEGYIDQKHLKNYLVNREKKKHPDKIIQEQLNRYLEEYQPTTQKSQNLLHSKIAENIQIDQDTDLSKLSVQQESYENIWKNEKIDSVNCLRCIRLKQNNIEEIIKLHKKKKYVPKQEFIGSLFQKIGRNQLALLVIDVNDISGSYSEIIVEQINKKEMHYLVIVNKVDTVSKAINLELLKQKIFENLQKQKIKLEKLTQQKIVLVSSKTGEGIKNLLEKLKDQSKILKNQKIQRRLFVLGSINSGKSSFLNALMKECKKQQKNIFYRDPFDEEYKQMLKSIKTSLELQEDEKTVLVQSYVPGSTQRVVQLSIPKIGFSCYDTPGILNNKQPFNFVSDFKTIRCLSFQSEVKPVKIQIKQNSTVWFGALIRFDNLSVVQKAQYVQNKCIFA